MEQPSWCPTLLGAPTSGRKRGSKKSLHVNKNAQSSAHEMGSFSKFKTLENSEVTEGACVQPVYNRPFLSRKIGKREQSLVGKPVPTRFGKRACVFSKVDLASAFWHLELVQQSSMLTTFATPHGRFRWLRLPFGLSVSREIFQKHLHQELQGLPGVNCIADDVLIYGKITSRRA